MAHLRFCRPPVMRNGCSTKWRSIFHSPAAPTFARSNTACARRAPMVAHAAYTCLISVGFTLFTSAVAKMLGFHEHRANELVVRDGKLTGEVKEPILGRAAKLATLLELRESFDLDDIDTLAV